METENRGKQVRDKMMIAISEYINEHGYAPSIKEIAEAVNLKSTSTVHHHMSILFQEGRLETDAPGTARAYRINRRKLFII